jgi:hypothetical protein
MTVVFQLVWLRTMVLRMTLVALLFFGNRIPIRFLVAGFVAIVAVLETTSVIGGVRLIVAAFRERRTPPEANPSRTD